MANYAYVENNNIEGLYDTLPLNWRNISNFYVTADEDLPMGWCKIIKSTVEYDPTTQMLGEIDYYLLGTSVYERVQILDIPQEQSLTPEQIENNKAIRWEEIRQERDKKMADFQWRYSRYDRQIRMSIPTVDNLENMDAYMQALADITMQLDPYNIVWPEYVG